MSVYGYMFSNFPASGWRMAWPLWSVEYQNAKIQNHKNTKTQEKWWHVEYSPSVRLAGWEGSREPSGRDQYGHKAQSSSASCHTNTLWKNYDFLETLIIGWEQYMCTCQYVLCSLWQCNVYNQNFWNQTKSLLARMSGEAASHSNWKFTFSHKLSILDDADDVVVAQK